MLDGETSSSFWEMTSRILKASQATRNEEGVFCSPMPRTYIPDSLRRCASFVKSESEETRQNPSTWLEYRISIASMIIAESVEFFPFVLLYC